ncbi:6039bd08-4af7-4836-9051-2cf9a245c040 [Sclerotinia trifoliorum]|uniref:6039bd08-4af7-4836-9051-2cf9a245c040 n=1 Tax=Sclerotinia trifoliorum TaxID=28548 RepID=A0A8H2VVL5_9HELO|nr:6039bd08-4af7-4836-9051-2cf9a245c040 [Sclerotinia trifoliorum]
MDQDPVESSPERAVSSEPCSTHPLPFDDNEQHSARKRQKTSRSGSRSRSVDTTKASNIPPDSMSSHKDDSDVLRDSFPPSTPTRPGTAQSQTGPTSSRVTINLRTPQPPVESIYSSSPSPNTPSKMTHIVDDEGARISIESESDVLSTVPASVIETSSSSPSAMEGSPEVELVPISSDDPERSPTLGIIDEEEVFPDPLNHFPTQRRGENMLHALRKVLHILQFDAIDTEDLFDRLRAWIDDFLRFASSDNRLHNAFTRHKDFWIAFPDMIWALSCRSRYFGNFMNRLNSRCKSLTHFLYGYAKLSGRFLAMDVKSLSYGTDQIPELVSAHFLHTYSHLQKINSESNHIGRSLETHYNWRWEEDTAELQTYFEDGGGSMLALTKFVEGQLRFLPNCPRLFENFSEPSKLMDRMTFAAAATKRQSASEIYDDSSRRLAHGYNYFNLMSSALDSIIEKNATLLTPEAANTHLQCLTQILWNSATWNPRIAKARIEIHRKICPDLPDAMLSKAMALEWKFFVLQKLITSTQMQLRVVGVTTMCADLLNLHSTYRAKEAPPSGGLVLLHFAKLVLQHKLINYIVGIGSHPEIINESSNIVGFLVVTKTYEDEQTDLIWQTVITSQDPRVVEAILKMMKKTLNLHEYPACLYICQKVASLPIQAFTVAMREFCEHLFRELSSKVGRRDLDASPYDICVRLIRESSIISDEYPNGYPEIQSFAASHLRELLVHGPGQEARTDIYLSCIKDISDKTATAPGSICVVSALLHQSLMPDLHTLTTQHGLTRLMVDELESNIAGNRSLAYDSPANIARREILLQIILMDPDTINAELGTRLWNLLVGSQSNDTADRLAGWQILNKAFQKAKFCNRYLTICFQNYLPHLEPNHFLDGTLLFVKSGVYFWLEEKEKESQEDENVKLDLSFDFLAMEQLWRIIESAPQGKVYEQAIQELVGVYVGPFIRSLPHFKARELHLAFLTRCLDKLADAAGKLKTSSTDGASGDDEDMVIVLPEFHIQGQELLFIRSLAALQTFLAAYSCHAHFATPKLRPAMSIPSDTAEGTSLTIMYQAFGETTSCIKKLTIGAKDTAATLVAKLQKETDFTSCRVFYSGREFMHDDAELCKSVESLNLNGLVLVKRRDETDPPLPSHTGPLQLEITRNFDQIWSYLGMQENLAEKIYSFLIQFPVYDKVLQDLSNSAVPYTEIFPLGQPYKALYGLYGLKQYISSQSSKGFIDTAGFDRAMALLVAAISDPKFLESCAPQTIRETLAMHFISSLASLLKDPALPASSTAGIDDKLLERLLDLLYAAKSVTGREASVHLIWTSVEALLEVAIQNSALWRTFVRHLNGSDLLQNLLLEDLRPFVRKAISKHITSKCTFSPNPAHVSPSEVAITLWPIVAKLIPEAVKRPEQCVETFQLALTIFKRLLETEVDVDLVTVAREWGELLIHHDNCEDVGVPEAVDMVTQGLVNLLHHAVMSMKHPEQKLSCEGLGVHIFKRRLFPTISNEDDIGNNGLIAQKIPVINSKTRHTMGETVLALVKDDITQYKELLQLLSEVAPYEHRAIDPYLFDMQIVYERSKAVRSPTGYVGLKNLSNTCYLNSLVTQLFMNLSFREFILHSPVTVPGSQKLLIETQQLFSFMQNSMQRFVDPTNFAASITTFEETEIDVTVQMDVDEFYNLLFDRFERENLTDDDKRKVRSFYGGKLVQQIKSQECPHISGRLEDFSAIQCDIKGKKSLQESLQAYVEGEAMEGENKYKCEACDRHVNAVKRACLTDVPDNLIFHLKRFDYNLRTMTRNKINDHFTFPPSIDMRPYKVEYLMNESGEVEEDMFELVGVLVHTGTAETGHYYSYIRERPQVGGQENWVEFNDDAVTSWEPGFMESACFGGLEHGAIDNMPFEKNYSAYMLFYQRSSTLTVANDELAKKDNGVLSKAVVNTLQGSCINMKNKPVVRNPLKIAVEPRQANHITLENELVMRKYCLHDPAHVLLVRNMFENTRHLNKLLHNGKCSDPHDLEKQAMWVAMCHLDQVVARSKDVPDLGTYVNSLRAQCQYCGECSRDFLDYLCRCTDSFRFLLLKCPEAAVRSEVGVAVLGALLSVKNGIRYAYGLSNGGRVRSDDPNLLQDVVAALVRLYENFHNSIRAWPEYFGLLASIANLGNHEAAVLLDSGFLMKAIDIICADTIDNDSQLTRMLQAISKRNLMQRPVSYDSIIDLLARLISVCDPVAAEIDQSSSRLQLSLGGRKIPFSFDERNRINCHWTRTKAHILTEKLLMINQNQHATKSIIATLLHFPHPDDLDLDQYMYCAITHGIKRNSQTLWGPFLRAAILYCEHSENPKAIPDMAFHVAKNSFNLDNNDGSEYLRFFKDLITLQSNSNDISQEEITKIVLSTLTHWVPTLLTHHQNAVRSDTEDFLGELIFNIGVEEDDTSPGNEQTLADHRREQTRRLGSACLEYLQDVYIRQRVQAVRTVMINIEHVVGLCLQYFEPGPAADRYKLSMDNLWNHLRRYMVEEVDDGSAWENSDDEYGSDEPMDNTTELCEPMDSELDGQL